MKKSTLLVCSLCLLLSFGSAMAWDLNDHVTVAPNGIGDVLIYPVYVAYPGGWETKITVINTSTVYATVAKLVVWSGRWTQEALDFFLYLSPADVWTGTLSVSGSNVVMTSTDDSCLNMQGAWASANAPFVQSLTKRCAQDDINKGYIEVFTAWTQPTAGPRSITKAAIKTAYETDKTQNNSPAFWGFGGTKGPKNILAGYYEIYNNSQGVNMLASTAAVALKDYDVGEPLDVAILTSFSEAVSPRWRNSIGEVEAALSKNLFAMPYYNGDFKKALHVFTLPTKLTQLSPACAVTAYRGPYFNVSTNVTASGAVTYTFGYFDLTEQQEQQSVIVSPWVGPTAASLPDEVNFVTPYYDSDAWTAVFTEGWALYNFNNKDTKTLTWGSVLPPGTNNLQYVNSVPAIAVVAYFTADGLSIMPGAYQVSNFVGTGTAADPYRWEPIVKYDSGAGFVDAPFYQYVMGTIPAPRAD